MTLNLSAKLKDLAVSETGFVFDPHSGATFTLSATGQAVLGVLRAGGTPEDAARALENAYEGTPKDVRDHVTEFVSLLKRHGLVHEGASPTRGAL
jgi:hypothetical protein